MSKLEELQEKISNDLEYFNSHLPDTSIDYAYGALELNVGDLVLIKHLLTKGEACRKELQEISEKLPQAELNHTKNAVQCVEEIVASWQPIDTFDSSMFSLMSDGTPEGTEVFKYKGHIPEKFKYWKSISFPHGEL